MKTTLDKRIALSLSMVLAICVTTTAFGQADDGQTDKSVAAKKSRMVFTTNASSQPADGQSEVIIDENRFHQSSAVSSELPDDLKESSSQLDKVSNQRPTNAAQREARIKEIQREQNSSVSSSEIDENTKQQHDARAAEYRKSQNQVSVKYPEASEFKAIKEDRRTRAVINQSNPE